MFFFLVPVVGEICREARVFAGVNALLVSVDCLQFLHERGDSAVQVSCGVGKLVDSPDCVLTHFVRIASPLRHTVEFS